MQQKKYSPASLQINTSADKLQDKQTNPLKAQKLEEDPSIGILSPPYLQKLKLIRKMF